MSDLLIVTNSLPQGVLAGLDPHHPQLRLFYVNPHCNLSWPHSPRSVVHLTVFGCFVFFFPTSFPHRLVQVNVTYVYSPYFFYPVRSHRQMDATYVT